MRFARRRRTIRLQKTKKERRRRDECAEPSEATGGVNDATSCMQCVRQIPLSLFTGPSEGGSFSRTEQELSERFLCKEPYEDGSWKCEKDCVTYNTRLSKDSFCPMNSDVSGGCPVKSSKASADRQSKLVTKSGGFWTKSTLAFGSRVRLPVVRIPSRRRNASIAAALPRRNQLLMPRKRRSEDMDCRPLAQLEEPEDDLQPTLDRFAEDTSMLGFRYLHTRYKTWFRVLWALVLFFFIGLTLYQVGERITYYFIRNPLTTRRSYETLPKMYFPTVGVCNKMQLKASAVAARDSDLLKALCLVHENNGSVTKNRTNLKYLNNFDAVDLMDIYRHGFQTADDLFVSCEFGKSGSCQDDIRPMLTPNGLCFAVSPNKTVLRPGPEATLSLLLNLEVHEIIPGMAIEPGVIFSIYDGQDSLSHFTEGIHLEAGKVVTIPVNEVRKLQRYEGNCGTSRMDSFSEKEYSKAACEWTRSVRQIEKLCHCRPMINPVFRGYMSGGVSSSHFSAKLLL
ncbi:unnamed protein product [Caenorhabditis auriculariae]|uniref:Uncharacterized protein n=1 Tax=Caenorhabditis auriculariae TaxID=2777116 RepID=A0A8S1HFA8_9PELO|nr:unnamed protein product [Caenorhabditis auriculariae]